MPDERKADGPKGPPLLNPPCLCGGHRNYYAGSLGYEAMVCEQCGEHWDDQTSEQLGLHAYRYRCGIRNNPPGGRQLDGLPVAVAHRLRLEKQMAEDRAKYPPPDEDEEERRYGQAMRRGVW